MDLIDQPRCVCPDGVLTAPTFATTPTHVLLPHREEQVPPTREQVDQPVTSDRTPALEWHAIDAEREGKHEFLSWWGLYDRVLFVLCAPVSCKNLVTQPLLEPRCGNQLFSCTHASPSEPSAPQIGGVFTPRHFCDGQLSACLRFLQPTRLGYGDVSLVLLRVLRQSPSTLWRPLACVV